MLNDNNAINNVMSNAKISFYLLGIVSQEAVKCIMSVVSLCVFVCQGNYLKKLS